VLLSAECTSKKQLLFQNTADRTAENRSKSGAKVHDIVENKTESPNRNNKTQQGSKRGQQVRASIAPAAKALGLSSFVAAVRII
jgi:hypothetical protein